MNAIKQFSLPSDSVSSGIQRPQPNSESSRPARIARHDLTLQIRSQLDKRIISLVAPLGSGKTSLLTDAFSGLGAVWLELMPKDHYAKNFFNRLTHAIRKIDPQFPAYVICPANEFLTATPQFAVGMFIEELNRLAAKNHAPLIIILDELHHLGGVNWAPSIVKIIEATHNVVWVLSGEYTHTLNLKHIKATGDFFQLTEKQLYFSLAETERVLLKAGPSIHFQTVLNALHSRNGSWPYGAGLAVSFLQQNNLKSRLDIEINSGSFTLNLIDILVRQQSESVKQLIQASVFLNRFNKQLCMRVTESPDCARSLSILESINGILVKTESDKLCYRYHPVVQEHLKEQFTNLPPGCKDPMVSRACNWLIENDFAAEAYHAAEYHSQSEFIAEIKQQCLKTAIRLIDVEMVLEWIKNKTHVSPALGDQDRLAWCWALSLSGHIKAAQNELSILLRSVLPGYEHDPDSTIKQLFLNPANKLQCHMAIIYVALQAMHSPLSTRLLDYLNTLHSNTLVSPGVSARIENILAHHYCVSGDFSRAKRHLKLAASIAKVNANSHCLIVSIYIQARIEMLSGDLNGALEICNRFLSSALAATTKEKHHLILALRAYIFYCGIKPQIGIAEAHALAASNVAGLNSNGLVQVFSPLLHDHLRHRRYDQAKVILNFLDKSAQQHHSKSLQVHVILEHFRYALIRSDQLSINAWVIQYQLPEKVAQSLDSKSAMEWNIRENWLVCAIFYHVSQGKFSEASRLNAQLLYLNIECGYPVRYLPIAMMQTWLDYQGGRRSNAFFKLNEILAQAEISAQGYGLFDIIPDATEFVSDALADNRINSEKHRNLLRNLGY